MICCIKYITLNYELYVFNLYLPCDNIYENDSYDFIEHMRQHAIMEKIQSAYKAYHSTETALKNV